MKKKKLFIIIMATLVLFAIPLHAALTTSIDTESTWRNAYRFTGQWDDNFLNWCVEMEDLVDDWDGDTLTFSTYAGTFGQPSNNVFKFTETPSDAEDLLLTFGADAVTLSSSTSVVFSFGTMIPNVDGLQIDSYIYLTPVDSPPASTEGYIYADTDHQLYYYDGSGHRDLTAGASGITDLDTAYDGGITIDVDAGAVALTAGDGDDNIVLAIVQEDTGNTVAMTITSAAATASTAALDIDAQTTGRDIEGTGASFYVEGDGSIVGVDLDLTGSAGITLENNGTITNTPDGTFLFTDGGESLSVYLNNNIAALGTGTDVATLAFGDVDALTGIDEVTFDTTTTSTITKAGTANSDFTLSQSGSADNSLILSSSGTTGDALQITTTAGGIDITNGGAAGGEDLDIDAVLASLNLGADEDVAEAITIVASAGGIDITADGATDKDLDLTCTSGSINIKSGENHAGSMLISTGAGGGTGEIITILNDQGNTDNSIDIDSTAGGLDIDMAGSIAITSTEGSTDSVALTSTDGGMDIVAATNGTEDMDIQVTGATDSHMILYCEGTSENAMQLTTTAGGIELLNGGETDGEDLELTSTTESVILNGGEDAATAITLFASNGAGGIDIDCGSGGINIDASAGAFTIIGELPSTLTVATSTDNEDLTISVTGTSDSSILMTSAGTGDDAISLQATGSTGGIDIDTTNDGPISIVSTDDLILGVTSGTAGEDILITNTTTNNSKITIENTGGTGADAISLNASGIAGGIVIDTDNGKVDIVADGSANGDIDIDAEDQIVITSADDTGTDSILITTTAGTSSNIKVNNQVGTGAAAVEIVASAGGITLTSTGASVGDMLLTVGNDILIDAAGAVDITSATASDVGDITLDAEAASIILDAGQDVVDAITLVCTGGDGGIDITSLGPIDITTTGASGGAQDITITNTGGSLIFSATENADDVIYIHADGGATESVKIHSDQGTSADSIYLLSDLGGIDITAEDTAAGDILIDANDTLTLLAAGLAADSIYIHQDGGTVSTIYIHADTGTAADSIELLSDVGGIDITAESLATGDILIDANDKLTLLSSSIAAQGIYIHANGGTSETIQIHADQGTSATSIYLKSDAGGITLLADGASTGNILIDAEDVLSLTAADPIGILVSTGSAKTHNYAYYGIGYVDGTHVTVTGGGSPLVCTGLAAGVAEAGSTQGYTMLDDAADILLFSIRLPDDCVITDTDTDFVLDAYLHEQDEGTIVNINLYNYGSGAAIFTDTYSILDTAGVGWVNMTTKSTGFGADTDLDGDDTLIIKIDIQDDPNDVDVYGFRLKYRCGLVATQ